MRILLVLDRVENPASANALMGFRLAEQLLRRDHTVHILTLWDGLHTPPAPPEGAMQHLLAFADERQMNEALENGQKGGTPVPLRLARLAAHPAAAAAAFRQLVLKQPRRTVDSRREIERLDAEFHFDAVCAVCAPYRTAFALEAAAIRGKKFLWQLDPYASNRDYTAPGGFAREGQLLDVLDGYKVHFVTGHTHLSFNVTPEDDVTGGREVYEHNAGAICASWWWSGYLTPGVHISPDGTPGGYSVWDVNGTDIEWIYKATGVVRLLSTVPIRWC